MQARERDHSFGLGPELLVILLVPVLLTAIHFLVPGPVQSELAFSHERFAVYTLLTSAYVHLSVPHLWGNILGFLLPAIYVYGLSIPIGEEQWVRRTMPVFLVVLPMVVNLTSYASFSAAYPLATPVTRGFSGVAAGFGGFLLVALVVYVRSRYSARLGNAVGYSAFMTLMVVVDVIYAGRIRFQVGGLLLFGISVAGTTYLEKEDFAWDVDRAKLAIDAVAVVLALAALVYVIVVMFPRDATAGGYHTDTFAHAAGFLYGAMISNVVYYLRGSV
jgi:hypothetical protein